MKKIQIPLCIFVTLAGLAAAAVAQSPSPSSASAGGDPFAKDKQPQAGAAAAGPVNICFTVEVYALAQDDAAKLLEDNPGGEARHARVLELVTAGKASFETLLSDVTKSGQRSVVEQADEVRYGTEFNPPQVPGNEVSMPTAYATRNTGESLEFEPVTSPDHTVCDINMALNSVRFHGFADIPGRPQDAVAVAMPRFESRIFTTSMTLITGKTQFLGTLSAPPQIAAAGGGAADAQQVRLVFGRISLVTIDTADSPAQKEDPTLEHQLVFYSLDREAARKILAGDQKADSYYDAVRALADRKQAHLERITVLKTKSGQRAVMHEVDEDLYGTEYNPNSFVPPVWTPGAVMPGGTKPLPLSDVTPTGFETRNTGLSLEIEPVADKSIVDINLAPQIVRDIGNLQANGAAAKFSPQPVFESNKVTTSLSAPLGGHAFIGTFSPPGDTGVNGKKDTGRVWFAFIRTSYAQP